MCKEVEDRVYLLSFVKSNRKKKKLPMMFITNRRNSVIPTDFSLFLVTVFITIEMILIG